MQTDSPDSAESKSIVSTYLPWVITAGALVFYLFTLHRWLTVPGLTALPHVSGWDWQPMHHAPLHFLLTYPIRWLPPSWQIVGLNFFTALCASISLGLLARSVMLLPHDRTRDQRQFERSDYSFLTIRLAWVPPLFAALVCGLQFTFWQHAIVATGEALDIMLFAYVVHTLLRARVDARDSLLARAAFVYGAAMTNNFAMIGFFPAFLVALVWIRGMRLIDSGVIIPVVLWGLAGLSLYLLLPIVNSLGSISAESFWEMVRMNIGAQKHALMRFPRYFLLLLSLTSILPVIFVGIRWPASFGDISAIGNALTNLMTHMIHAVFLVACLYVSFDPPFSPRRLASPYPLLPFYFLGALSVGYFTGYFLLVFAPRVAKGWQRASTLRMVLNYLVQGTIYLAVLVLPIALYVHNRAEIARNRDRALRDYGQQSVQTLPPQGAVILSDDPVRLYAVAAALDERNAREKYILVQTTSLTQPTYHEYLTKKYPKHWPSFLADRPADQIVEGTAIVDVLRQLRDVLPLYYLHPSFGYFFESFYQEPRNLVYALHPYPTNQIAPPPLSTALIASNDQFWRTFYGDRLASVAKRLAAEDEQDPDTFSVGLGAMYSRQLNHFGVEVQRSGDLTNAAEYFRLALEVNPRNPTAYINRDYNQQVQLGQMDNFAPSEGATNRLAPYARNWNAILRDNGPVDEPNSCYLLAGHLARGKNYRQCAQQLLRVIHFQPENLQAHISMAVVLARAGFAQDSLTKAAQIRSRFNIPAADFADQISLLQAEAWGYVGLGQWERAEKLLNDTQDAHPQDGRPFAALAEIYVDFGRITNAMAVFQKQLTLQPRNLGALINYSALKIQNREFATAIEVLNEILKNDSKYTPALQNRAIAYFLSGQLDQAERDYETLRDATSQPSHSIYYGLGEIAYRKRKREAALNYYQRYLELAPNDAPELRSIRDRVKLLNRGSF